MDNSKVFINLTNGIEAIEEYNLDINSVHFLRIQSSHVEEHKWELILNQLDHNFIISLALGYNCVVYDYGAQCDFSKAIYFGLEWVRYFLNRRWFNQIIRPKIKDKFVDEYFEAEYGKISKKTKKRIDYYKSYLITDNIYLEGITKSTNNDNNIEYYRSIISRNIESTNQALP